MFRLIVLLAYVLPLGAGAAFEGPLDLMREGGKVLLIRHAATVPGLGDPPGFRLDDCTTQRNLSDRGREESRLIGSALRAAGVPVAEVRSSLWCRCIDTAELAFGDWDVPIMRWPPLNSFFAGQGDRVAQTAASRAALADLPAHGNWVWVTHQVNITALTGVSAAMGEIIIAVPVGDSLQVLGRWRP